MDNIKWPCNRLFLHSGSHLHFEYSQPVSWPSQSSCAVWKCPPKRNITVKKKKNGTKWSVRSTTVCRTTLLNLWLRTAGVELKKGSSRSAHLCATGIERLFLSRNAVLNHLLSDRAQPLLHPLQLSAHLLRKQHWLLRLKHTDNSETYFSGM